MFFALRPDSVPAGPARTSYACSAALDTTASIATPFPPVTRGGATTTASPSLQYKTQSGSHTRQRVRARESLRPYERRHVHPDSLVYSMPLPSSSRGIAGIAFGGGITFILGSYGFDDAKSHSVACPGEGLLDARPMGCFSPFALTTPHNGDQEPQIVSNIFHPYSLPRQLPRPFPAAFRCSNPDRPLRGERGGAGRDGAVSELGRHHGGEEPPYRNS